MVAVAAAQADVGRRAGAEEVVWGLGFGDGFAVFADGVVDETHGCLLTVPDYDEGGNLLLTIVD